MSNSTELRKKQHERMVELSNLAIQRRLELEAKGDTRRRSGRKGDDYLTEAERQEFFALGRQLSGFYVKDSYAHHLGESWKLADNSPLLKDEAKSEA